MASCLIVVACSVAGFVVGELLGYDGTEGGIVGGVAGLLLARFTRSHKW